MSSESTQSPKEFLRARRPEYFSDSGMEESKSLDRLQLEYHLSTLTDQLALAWFSGIGREASSERWALAFSTKKQWQAKVREDVRKIVGTGRGYRKVFFVSSQYVPDKSRAKFEDQLSQEFGIDVRILDRNWILDKVFSNHREALAIEHLRLSVSVVNSKRSGPQDSLRESELNELDQRIQDEVGDACARFRLVEDCIRSAELARALERPRTEVDGRFERATGIAEQFGTQGQQIECAYEKARTAYWWYEDYPLFAKAYAEVQQLCAETSNPHELEQLRNLWFILLGAVERGHLKRDEVCFAGRTDFLKSKLFTLSQNKETPSASLYAETQLLEVELALSLKTGEHVNELLGKIKLILSDCAGLVGYPFEGVAKFVIELGDLLQEFSGYPDLFDTVVEITAERRSDVEAGRILITRGRQLLQAGRLYEAIAALGKALGKLYKRETRRDATLALYLSAVCYEGVGLFWAARGTLLTAEALADNELSETGKVLKAHGSCSRLLKWVELRLGRVAQALTWHRHDYLLRTFLDSQGDQSDSLSEKDLQFDVGLGSLILRSESTDLGHLTRLPKMLRTAHTPTASDCLLFVLGHENEISTPEESDESSPDLETLIHYADEMIGEELPQKPIYYEQAAVTLESQLLGCHIKLTASNVPASIRISESILAALESFLSTTSVTGLMARDPVFLMEISESQSLSDVFAWSITQKGGRPLVTVVCRSFVSADLLPENQGKTKSTLAQLITNVVAHFVTAENPKEVLEGIIKRESAFTRAIDFTGLHVSVEQITGFDGNRISTWSDDSLPEYKPQRESAWQAGKWRGRTEQDPTPRSFQAGEIPQHIRETLLDRAATKQSEIQTLSLIREKLWNDAGWMATAYLCPPDRPPLLVWVFTKKDAALQIILGLKEDITARDESNRLRIVIIRGIDSANPHHYRILLTSNMTGLKSRAKYFAVISKFMTMTPESDVNLNGFLRAFVRFGAFFITSGFAEMARMGVPEIFFEHSILKRELEVKWARDIGLNDPDSVGIATGRSHLSLILRNGPP